MTISIENNQPARETNTTRASKQGAVVLCAGRHAAEVLDVLMAQGEPVHGCLDAAIPIGNEVYPGVSVVGRDDALEDMVADGFETVYLGIGGLENLEVRIRLFQRLKDLGIPPPPLVHPSAHVAPTAELGAGTTVLARASIGPLSRVGCNCVITQNATITHHCKVEDHVVVAPGAVLAAGVHVKRKAVIGVGVTVFRDLVIGENSTIVNGIDLMQDVPNDSIAKHRGASAVVRSLV